ncbi:MAG TPA: 2-dehydropantoate 2-reductase [Burkholderiales bacterium]|jgi:2-dehydropantoate 2-reductase|nr:2-dehydropantoate 2-reductase [Burkholderiales bacterium]
MRIAVMGAGAVGGYFGALLAQAGHDVSFIARGAHMQAMRASGIVIDGPRGRVQVQNITVTDDPATLKPCDVVLFCVKTYDTESAAEAVRPLVAQGGVVITVQNGVDGQDRIAAVLGGDCVMGGLAMVSGVIAEPGVIRTISEMSSLRFGEANGSASPRAVAFADACTKAGFTAEIMPDIRSAQWQKFVGLATNAALTSLIRLPAGNIYHDPELLELTRRALAEVAAVARAQDIALPEDIVERALKLHQNFPPTMYASMYHDHARGRRTELESLSGLVVRRGRQYGVPTPVHEMAYLCLKPYVNGAPQPGVLPG